MPTSSEQGRRPVTGWALAIASIITVAFMGSVVVTPLYGLYQERFGFGDVTLTLVYATYVVGNVLALLVFGQVSDQLGRKRTTVPGLVLATLSALTFLFAQGTAELFVGRALIGLSVGVLSGTGTAWLAEHLGPENASTATVLAATANLGGIAVGPLVGGILAEYVPAPLVVPFVAYVVLVVLVGLAVARVPDHLEPSVHRVRDLRVRPRLGVPPDLLRDVTAPAVTGFSTFALGGLYFALVPGIMARDLGITNLAVEGLVVFELGIVAATCIVLGRRIRPARAMLTGLACLPPAVTLIVLAQALGSLWLLLTATAFGGITMAFGYRGSLQIVNQVAPAGRRAEIVSSYLVACFLGNSVPVIGISVLAAATNPTEATATFAVVIALLAGAAALWHRRAVQPHTVARAH